MKITPAIQKEMRRLRKGKDGQKGLTYEQIAERMADQVKTYASQVFYYCREAKDKEQLDAMERLREYGEHDGGDSFGIGWTYAQIGAKFGMSKYTAFRWLASRTVKPRDCLHDGNRMTPRGKFRLWCDERCHRAWAKAQTRTAKLRKERGE